MDKRQMENNTYVANTFNEYKEFIKDKQVSFVIRKTERIVYGIYMLARFVPSEESLNLELKRTSHAALQSVSGFVHAAGISDESIDRAQGQLQYLSSLLTLAFISGYISSSNIEIMKGEINYLHKHIEELSTRAASETGQLHLKADHFVVGQAKTARPAEERSAGIKDKQDAVRPPVSFKTSSPRKATPASTPVKPAPAVTVSETKDDRESRIKDVIRERGTVSIKDISSVVFDVGEKTIQRTLQALIDKGQIVKEGERRWAKYRIL